MSGLRCTQLLCSQYEPSEKFGERRSPEKSEGGRRQDSIPNMLTDPVVCQVALERTAELPVDITGLDKSTGDTGAKSARRSRVSRVMYGWN